MCFWYRYNTRCLPVSCFLTTPDSLRRNQYLRHTPPCDIGYVPNIVRDTRRYFETNYPMSMWQIYVKYAIGNVLRYFFYTGEHLNWNGHQSCSRIYMWMTPMQIDREFSYYTPLNVVNETNPIIKEFQFYTIRTQKKTIVFILNKYNGKIIVKVITSW